MSGDLIRQSARNATAAWPGFVARRTCLSRESTERLATRGWSKVA